MLNECEKIYVDKIDKGVIKMIELITGTLTPGKIIEQLERSGIIEPYKIINTFGGNMSSLAKYICYNKPSIFLHHHQSTTKQLFLLSRHILNVTLSTRVFTPRIWGRTKKANFL